MPIPVVIAWMVIAALLLSISVVAIAERYWQDPAEPITVTAPLWVPPNGIDTHGNLIWAPAENPTWCETERCI